MAPIGETMYFPSKSHRLSGGLQKVLVMHSAFQIFLSEHAPALCSLFSCDQVEIFLRCRQLTSSNTQIAAEGYSRDMVQLVNAVSYSR